MQTTKVIWTNGCFDVLHRGHIELFKYAKSLGDRLVVGIDTDERVKASKGETRPFNNIQDRVEMLQAIKYIDEVRVFDTDVELETQPLQDRITIVNKLYDQGHTIHFLTARGMGRSGNSTAFAYDAFEDLTRQQLKEWGVKYHRLFLGKPSGDFYIDDKGIKDEDFFNTRD